MLMRKKLVLVFAFFALILFAALGSIKLYRVYRSNQCGILLAFDDYNAESWERYFDFFDKYDVKVTFFVNASEPTDFCYKAIERGHEIAFHTINHVRLTEVSEEEVYAQAIAPIETFRQKGIELTTFAYPYGAYTEELNELLLQHYKVVRGAYYYRLTGKDIMRHGFVEAYPIDNGYFDSQESYEKAITDILEELHDNKAGVACVYSHAIDPGGAWCVSEEKLEFLITKAKELGLEFYTFQELQNH